MLVVIGRVAAEIEVVATTTAETSQADIAEVTDAASEEASATDADDFDARKKTSINARELSDIILYV